MYASNLAIVFGPTLLRPPPGNDDFALAMRNLGAHQNLVKNLILQYHWLFDVEQEQEQDQDQEQGQGQEQDQEQMEEDLPDIGEGGKKLEEYEDEGQEKKSEEVNRESEIAKE